MIRRFALPFVLVLAVACGGDSTAPRDDSPSTVAVPAHVTVVGGAAQNAPAGQPLPAPLIVRVTDASNQPVAKVLVVFTINAGGGTLSQSIDTTDASGNASVTWTVGTSTGSGQVQARVASVATPAGFDIVIDAGPLAVMTRASSAVGATPAGFETGDSIAVRATDIFNNPIAGQAVSFSVAAGGGTVSAAAKLTGADGIARTSWTVGNAGAQMLRATAGSLGVDISATAVSCNEIALGVGDVRSLVPGDTPCMLLNGTGQQYLVTIVNATNSPVASTGYAVRGLAGAPVSPIIGLVSAASGSMTGSFSAMRTLSGAADNAAQESLEQDRVHTSIRERNMALLQRFGPGARAALRSTNRVAAEQQQPQQQQRPAVGDLIPMKVPDITTSSCANFTPSIARVVYVGRKGIVLEDTTNALRRQVDTLLTRVGREFDDVIFPILTANFGDPLAMDAQLNNDGAMYMLISDKVNATGATGFVSNSDFLPQCPSSNLAEVFYARGLTTPGSGTATLDFSFASTTRRLASTIIHESKHLTSVAAKLSQPGFNGNIPIENAWLEESSAEIAMELLSRVTYSRQAKSNLDYATTLAKEARPASGLPLNMFHPFTYLYTYFAAPETHSLVGPAGTGDFTFYGSGWAFLRWVIDTYATNEAAFLTAMNRDISNWGVANIEHLTGKSFPQLLGEFSLAIAIDDYPGFTPTDPKYSFPSWNLRSILTGMNTDFPGLFPNATPLMLRSSGFGRFGVDVGGVRGGGFSVLQLAGAATSKQLLEFKGASGAPFPAVMRVNIVRIQ